MSTSETTSFLSNPTYISAPSSQETLLNDESHHVSRERRAEEALYREQTKQLKKILQGLKHGFNLRPKEIEYNVEEVPPHFYMQFLLSLQVK